MTSSTAHYTTLSSLSMHSNDDHPSQNTSTIAGSSDKDKGKPTVEQLSLSEGVSTSGDSYKLYKRRWTGVAALFILEAVASMPWVWFGLIATQAQADMGFTATQVNWLGTMIACAYLLIAFQIPLYVRYLGVRKTTYIGAGFMILSAWVRYAGTARSLSTGGSYALIILGQFFAGLSQPVFQILAPKYSELWFDLKTRTTATMIISIANPIGGAIGQLISPTFDDTRTGILVLGIISTGAAVSALFIQDKPPTPPTFAGSQDSPGLYTLFQAVFGRDTQESARMSVRERLDFAILVWVFASMFAAINVFGVLSSAWLGPYGYSDDTSGLMGATLLISGIVAALVTAPLVDRVLTSHIGLTIRVLCPIIGAAWLGFIWAVRRNSPGPLFALCAIIGACSISLLPIAIELAAELTRNTDGSSATLWFFGNLMCVIFIEAQDALRAPANADPPLNMHSAFIFVGVWTCASSFFVFFLKGRQARRERDLASSNARVLEAEV
ncbi:unnamed protein product [Peniophora sp. CBMAI 1063]|nr:unnamed protein product [Peniophora sp. CBMAI 1063]